MKIDPDSPWFPVPAEMMYTGASVRTVIAQKFLQRIFGNFGDADAAAEAACRYADALIAALNKS